LWEFAAQHGEAKAQVNLASFYFVGKYVPKDFKETARWFRAAAEQGEPIGETGLAFLYYRGQGVEQNAEEAAKWMRRAAEQGYAQAQTNLGCLFERGEGVPLEYVSAYMWYSLGSNRNPGARARLKDLSRIMTARQIIKAKDRASMWLSSYRPTQPDEETMGFALR
jgi:TPR repeat protein